MIVKMSRYDFVLLATQSDDFIARLRELGLVDITTTGWEPREQDRQLVVDIDHYAKAIDKLKDFAESESMQAKAEAYATGEEAFEAYTLTQQRKATLVSELARLEKMSEDLLPWGEFTVESREKLLEQGVVLRYFVASKGVFDEESRIYLSHIAPKLHAPHTQIVENVAKDGLLVAYDGLTVLL